MTLTCSARSMRLRPSHAFLPLFVKSIFSSSLCSLSAASTSTKNAVYLLLKFFLPVSTLNWCWNITPMIRVHKMVLKKIFDSPEFNRSVIFSGWPSMTKKMDQFLRYWIIVEQIILWFNIGPSYFRTQVFVDELAKERLCGLALAFDRLAESLAFNFKENSSNCISDVSCSLLFKFETNLFKPWESLTLE